MSGSTTATGIRFGDVAAGRFDGGWTIEAAIPFKSLRYRLGRAQIWGFNARRSSKWKNEISYLVQIPPAFGLGRGSFAASRFATVVGLEAPPGAKNVEIKPYAIADLTTDYNATPRVSNDPGGDLGLDVKYGVTQNLTADFTYNTDFAQVEADEQQVNLTRFSLFFPEKREFFLENQGTFTFGAAATGMMMGAGETPILFTAGGLVSIRDAKYRFWPAAGSPDELDASASGSSTSERATSRQRSQTPPISRSCGSRGTSCDGAASAPSSRTDPSR